MKPRESGPLWSTAGAKIFNLAKKKRVALVGKNPQPTKKGIGRKGKTPEDDNAKVQVTVQTLTGDSCQSNKRKERGLFRDPHKREKVRRAESVFSVIARSSQGEGGGVIGEPRERFRKRGGHEG